MGPSRNKPASKPAWKRSLFSPLASLVLAVCLWFDAWSLPEGSLAKIVTGMFIVTGETTGCGGRGGFLCLVRTDKGLSTSWDLPSSRDIDVEEWLVAGCPGRLRTQHLWANTGETIDHTFTLTLTDTDSPDTITGAERKQARAIYAQFQEVRHGDPLMARAVRSGDGTTTFPYWRGYLHNTLALGAFLLFGVSLAWIPRYALLPSNTERLAAGVCPRCQYSLAGLPEPRCPECGATWNRAEPHRGPDDAANAEAAS